MKFRNVNSGRVIDWSGNGRLIGCWVEVVDSQADILVEESLENIVERQVFDSVKDLRANADKSENAWTARGVEYSYIEEKWVRV